MFQTEIETIVQERGITEVVHFTSNHGLVGCLDKGCVLSTSRLRREDRLASIFRQTAPVRVEEDRDFNKERDWLDYISMSVSEINTHYFKYAKKWHAEDEHRFWIILSFSAEIMAHENVYFTTTNNTYNQHVRRGLGSAGLQALFASTVVRKQINWIAERGDRAPNLPTCEQAEVLYPKALPMKFLRKIYVQTGAESDMVHAYLKNCGSVSVEVVTDAKKFVGAPN